MTSWKTIAAAMLLLVIGLAGSALAQEGDYGQPPAQQADPSPMNPSQKIFEGGKVLVTVGSTRHFGYHIGDVIPVTVVFSVDPGTQVNTEAIQRRILSANGSDFEVDGAPVVTHLSKSGKEITILTLKLRCWVPKQTLVFTADFYYATGLLPDGKPQWTPATTPDFVVTTSNTATDSSKEVIDGDLDTKVSPTPSPVLPLRVAGGFLLLLLPGWLLWKLYRRINPPRVVPPHELAWATFDRVLTERNASGFTYGHTQQIAHALRTYLRVESLPLGEAKFALEQFFALQDKRFELVAAAESALSKLDKALYQKPQEGDSAKSNLTDRELKELFEEIELLVPRP